MTKYQRFMQRLSAEMPVFAERIAQYVHDGRWTHEEAMIQIERLVKIAQKERE